MMYDNQKILTSVDRIIAMGLKISGELVKVALLSALEKVKETKENKVGLTNLKNLLKSKEELGVIKLNKENLPEFKKKAKALGVVFSSISIKDNNEVKIMYKTRQTNQVKECLSEILEQQQANKLDEIQEKAVYDSINKNMDFPSPDDGLYRHSINNIDNEKSIALSSLLLASNIKNEIAVTNINDDNTFNVNYIVSEKDKDRVTEILEANKDKSIEELANMLRPQIINPNAIGLDKYGVNADIKKYQDKWGKERETFSMSLGDKVVNHALEDKHYSTISDTLERLYFTKDQIEELKLEDPFIQERVKKEEYYEKVLNKSNKGKEPLDNLIKKAEKVKEDRKDQAIEKMLEATSKKLTKSKGVER